MIEEAALKISQAESFPSVLCGSCLLSACADPTLFSEEL